MAKSLNEQAEEILRIAETSGVQSNFLFITVFKRYQVQLNNLTKLEIALRQDTRPTVNKEYVKGRENVVIHPLIQQYDKTTDSANKTVATLLRIIRTFSVGENQDLDRKDDLMAAINGGDDYEETD
jgi:tRNA(Phe) wybutosine-synthesizing methylase Tyw3